MTAHPIFYQYLLASIFDNGYPDEETKIDVSDNRLVWHLRSTLGCNYYVCLKALECYAREEDCSTPLFKGDDIPDYVLDWMNHYAKTIQVGAAWQRQIMRNRK